MSVVPLIPPPTPAKRFLSAALERRVPVVVFVLAVMAISVFVSFQLKPWFRAEATLLPPTDSGDVFTNLTGMIESSALSRVGLLSSASTASDVYIEILKSRRLREALVHRFDLMRLYKTKGMDRTIRELNTHVSLRAGATGVITVNIEDHDRRRAADMTNFLVSELDRFNRETLQTRGKRMREFLEQRVADSEKRMHDAATSLTAYERTNKVVVASDAAAMKGMVDVAASKLSLQVRRSYVAGYSAPGSPEVRQIDAEIEAFDRELGDLPRIKNEGARLALEAEIQGKVFALLTAQYEEARIQEMRDTPTVTVLDIAQPPELKSRPKRAIIVLGSTFFASLLAAGWIVLSMRRTALA